MLGKSYCGGDFTQVGVGRKYMMLIPQILLKGGPSSLPQLSVEVELLQASFFSS